jgi:hypothetical protein
MITIAISKSGTGYEIQIADRFCDQNRCPIFILKSITIFSGTVFDCNPDGDCFSSPMKQFHQSRII